ncbi:Hypothetical_protein [Hexamita inflata]|uniref:Hypothetical_protein n=1 Tax=Hexamita inflata TaxID=28002 RepID=A0AA86RDS4_9EUKA|nr:Hypothetical protein HINF_LOCUS64069 [Hexamita inflata]
MSGVIKLHANFSKHLDSKFKSQIQLIENESESLMRRLAQNSSDNIQFLHNNLIQIQSQFNETAFQFEKLLIQNASVLRNQLNFDVNKLQQRIRTDLLNTNQTIQDNSVIIGQMINQNKIEFNQKLNHSNILIQNKINQSQLNFNNQLQQLQINTDAKLSQVLTAFENNFREIQNMVNTTYMKKRDVKSICSQLNTNNFYYFECIAPNIFKLPSMCCFYSLNPYDKQSSGGTPQCIYHGQTSW